MAKWSVLFAQLSRTKIKTTELEVSLSLDLSHIYPGFHGENPSRESHLGQNQDDLEVLFLGRVPLREQDLLKNFGMWHVGLQGVSRLCKMVFYIFHSSVSSRPENSGESCNKSGVSQMVK